MDENKNKSDQQTNKNPDANVNPTARDFQRTENDIDSVSESEREQLNKEERTELANTKPDKEHVGG